MAEGGPAKKRPRKRTVSLFEEEDSKLKAGGLFSNKAPAAGGLFSNKAPAAGGLFGNKEPAAGSENQPQNGQHSTKIMAPPSEIDLFGSKPADSNTGGGLFSVKNDSNTGGGLFSAKNGTNTGGGLFSKPAEAKDEEPSDANPWPRGSENQPQNGQHPKPKREIAPAHFPPDPFFVGKSNPFGSNSANLFANSFGDKPRSGPPDLKPSKPGGNLFSNSFGDAKPDSKPSKPGGNLFASTFGDPKPDLKPSKPGGNLFANSFGDPKPDPKPSKPGGNLVANSFGDPKPDLKPSKPGGNLFANSFGNPKPDPKPSKPGDNLFSNSFGDPKPEPKPSKPGGNLFTSTFGQPDPKPSKPGGNLFGDSTSGGNLFSNSFGEAKPEPKPSKPGGNLFASDPKPDKSEEVIMSETSASFPAFSKPADDLVPEPLDTSGFGPPPDDELPHGLISPAKPVTKTDKSILVAECRLLCPPKEQADRDFEQRFNRNFEGKVLGNGNVVIDKSRLIKEYRRSAADRLETAEDIRTPATCLDAWNVLCNEVIDVSEVPFLDRWGYMEDRLRAITKDLTMQRCRDKHFIRIFEMCSRFRALAHFLLVGTDADGEGYWPKLNLDQLNSHFAELAHWDEDNAGSTRMSRAKLIALRMILEWVQSPRGSVNEALATYIGQPSSIRSVPEVRRVRELLKAYKACNARGFFRIYYSFDLLEQMLLHPVSDRIRLMTLKSLSVAYNTGGQSRAGTFITARLSMLEFESRKDQNEFLQYYGIMLESHSGSIRLPSDYSVFGKRVWIKDKRTGERTPTLKIRHPPKDRLMDSLAKTTMQRIIQAEYYQRDRGIRQRTSRGVFMKPAAPLRNQPRTLANNRRFTSSEGDIDPKSFFNASPPKPPAMPMDPPKESPEKIPRMIIRSRPGSGRQISTPGSPQRTSRPPLTPKPLASMRSSPPAKPNIFASGAPNLFDSSTNLFDSSSASTNLFAPSSPSVIPPPPKPPKQRSPKPAFAPAPPPATIPPPPPLVQERKKNKRKRPMPDSPAEPSPPLLKPSPERSPEDTARKQRMEKATKLLKRAYNKQLVRRIALAWRKRTHEAKFDRCLDPDAELAESDTSSVGTLEKRLEMLHGPSASSRARKRPMSASQDPPDYGGARKRAKIALSLPFLNSLVTKTIGPTLRSRMEAAHPLVSLHTKIPMVFSLLMSTSFAPKDRQLVSWIRRVMGLPANPVKRTVAKQISCTDEPTQHDSTGPVSVILHHAEDDGAAVPGDKFGLLQGVLFVTGGAIQNGRAVGFEDGADRGRFAALRPAIRRELTPLMLLVRNRDETLDNATADAQVIEALGIDPTKWDPHLTRILYITESTVGEYNFGIEEAMSREILQHTVVWFAEKCTLLPPFYDVLFPETILKIWRELREETERSMKQPDLFQLWNSFVKEIRAQFLAGARSDTHSLWPPGHASTSELDPSLPVPTWRDALKTGVCAALEGAEMAEFPTGFDPPNGHEAKAFAIQYLADAGCKYQINALLTSRTNNVRKQVFEHVVAERLDKMRTRCLQLPHTKLWSPLDPSDLQVDTPDELARDNLWETVTKEISARFEDPPQNKTIGSRVAELKKKLARLSNRICVTKGEMSTRANVMKAAQTHLKVLTARRPPLISTP